MSTITQKSKSPAESRSKMFLRSNSFQKLCSLAHPMRLKGFKSNKEALKSVFEALIVTTRGAIQSVTYRILCFVFLTPFARLVSWPLSVVSGRDGKLSTVRLILKLTLSTIVSTGDKAPKDATDEKLAPRPEAQTQTLKCIDTAVQTDPPADGDEWDQFFDCREDKPTTQELCYRFLENSRAPSAACTRNGQQRSLLVAVYGCILCCFVQLSALAYLLNVADTLPPGLIFLLAALGYIGYVMTRIFFDHGATATSANSKADLQPKATTMALVPKQATSSVLRTDQFGKGLHPILAAVVKRVASATQTSKTTPRPSRSTTRRLLCTEDKTISKMKIL